MRAPDGITTGNAKITISFADWKEGNVHPLTQEMSVVSKQEFPQNRAKKP